MNNQSKTPSIYVIKYGGNAMTRPQLQRDVLHSICQIKAAGHSVVLVHGGGPFIQAALDEVGIVSTFIGGHRKTPPEALLYVERALKGRVNTELVRLLQQLGERAVGLSGQDGNLVMARKRFHRESVDGQWIDHDLGQVGDVDAVNPELIQLLLAQNFIPVITCLANDHEGHGYNINGDMFAGHLAGALKAQAYLVLTDVDGLLEDRHDPNSLIHHLSLPALEQKLNDGTIQGGMIPKLDSCAVALKNGAHSARIINGTQPELLTQLLHNTSIGTLITHANP